MFAVFGPRGVGVSTLLRVVDEESATPTLRLGLRPGATPDELDRLEEAVEDARKRKVEAIFLDGVPASADEVQWLYDAHIIGVDHGSVVRVDRNVVVDPSYTARLTDIEARLVALSLPYTVIRADDSEQAVIHMLRLSGVFE